MHDLYLAQITNGLHKYFNMKVKDLLEILKDYDPETEVVVSADGEGNSFSPASGAEGGFYFPESKAVGVFCTLSDLEEGGWGEMYDLKDGQAVICIWPSQ